MKNIKSITLGILIGAIATLSITALAEYIVHPNPYPVKVNGVEAAIEGYNINDETYFKLRDVSAAVGGFEVGFSDNTITVDTETVSTVTPAPTEKPNLSPLPELKTETRDGVQYVSKYDINDMLKSIGLDKFSIIGYAFYNNDDVLNPLLNDIPIYEHGIDLIPLDYYNSTIIPLINNLR